MRAELLTRHTREAACRAGHHRPPWPCPPGTGLLSLPRHNRRAPLGEATNLPASSAKAAGVRDFSRQPGPPRRSTMALCCNAGAALGTHTAVPAGHGPAARHRQLRRSPSFLSWALSWWLWSRGPPRSCPAAGRRGPQPPAWPAEASLRTENPASWSESPAAGQSCAGPPGRGRCLVGGGPGILART